MLKINYVPSTSHWIFPPIIIKILFILLFIMLIMRYLEAKRKGIPFFDFKNYSFFIKNWDKLKLLGALVLFILYLSTLQVVGFLADSILFIFLFNILFSGIENLKEFKIAILEKTFLKNKGFKSIVNSFIISTIFSVLIWLIFGQVFQITLP